MNQDDARPSGSKTPAMATFAAVLLGACLLGWASLALRDATPKLEPAAHVAVGEALPDQASGRELTLDQFVRMVRQKSAIIVDARSASRFAAGHVPGAVNLPARALNQPLPEAVQDYGTLMPIVVYCESANCSDSQTVARRLREAGLQRVWVFEGGWESWKQHVSNEAEWKAS